MDKPNSATNETRLILFKLMNFSDIYLDIYLYV